MTVRRIPTNAEVEPQYQAAVSKIEKWGPIWQKRMELSHIEIQHSYLDVGSSMLLGADPKNRPGVVRCGYGAMGESSYTACVETLWNYQRASVFFFLPSVILWDSTRLEQIVVHEYSHILCAAEQYLLEYKIEELAADEEMTSTELDKMAALYYERMEMATENVARAVYAGWVNK